MLRLTPPRDNVTAPGSVECDPRIADDGVSGAACAVISTLVDPMEINFAGI